MQKDIQQLPFASASVIGGSDRKDISDVGKLGFWEDTCFSDLEVMEGHL